MTKYELPTAEELRQYQSKRRIEIIKAIRDNATLGYTGVSLESKLFPVEMEKELVEAGYKVEYYGESSRYISIVWGKEE